MSRQSEGLYLLQRVRDEAHRFAITYHRAKRGKAVTTSALDDVPGLGPARRSALLKAFGSVKALSGARAEEIAAVPGIGRCAYVELLMLPVLGAKIADAFAKTGHW